MNTILQKLIEEATNIMFGHQAIATEAMNYILANQWISVEEALPDYEEDVIVTNSYDDYWFAHRSNNEKVIVDEYGFARTPTVLRITHWMPIPSLEGGEE